MILDCQFGPIADARQLAAAGIAREIVERFVHRARHRI
jgi:hypothetical protein